MELHFDWKSIGSLLATFMFIRTAMRDFLPPQVSKAIRALFSKIFTSLKSRAKIIIEEFDNGYANDPFDAVQSYLSSKCYSSAQVLKLMKSKNTRNLTFIMDTNQNFQETYDGFRVRWSFHVVEKKPITSHNNEKCFFRLSFDKRYKEKVQLYYIPYVLEEAAVIMFKNRERKLYTNRPGETYGRPWSSIPFMHPSTFATLAMDPVLKEEIKEDLLKFVSRKEFYNRVGRAWKRGYLLYGPPRTGKTSLIAAIANFLEFDIYDLELTSVSSNSHLRKLLISTSSKSVIIVEDIDCSLDLSDRKKKENGQDDEADAEKLGEKLKKQSKDGEEASTVSLSGVLNFVDGLWSSCAGERLMIFTTNHKEKLDEALLRPGRMDKHINLSYCEIQAFKMLMKGYLAIDEHELLKDVEEMLPVVKMTPADIGEVFMSSVDDADVGMKNVVGAMKKKLRAMEDASIGEDLKEEEPAEREKLLETDKERPLLSKRNKLIQLKKSRTR